MFKKLFLCVCAFFATSQLKASDSGAINLVPSPMTGDPYVSVGACTLDAFLPGASNAELTQNQIVGANTSPLPEWKLHDMTNVMRGKNSLLPTEHVYSLHDDIVGYSKMLVVIVGLVILKERGILNSLYRTLQALHGEKPD
jgi:hypothetical protein